MGEVKAPDLREAARDALLACEETASWARLQNEAVSKRLRRVVTALRAALEAEYVPATNSPDREPDAPFAYGCPRCFWTCSLAAGCGRFCSGYNPSLNNYQSEHESTPMVPLYRNPPDRSDGLREALEGLTRAVQPILAESRSFKCGEPLTLLKVPLLPDELTEARDALGAARLALKAEEGN